MRLTTYSVAIGVGMEQDAMGDDDDSDDFTIDLAPNARTTDRKFTFGGLLLWNIYAPKPLGKTVNPKDALSIRVARMVQACVRLKQLGDNPKAADYVPLVIRVVQAFDGAECAHHGCYSPLPCVCCCSPLPCVR